LIRLSRFLAQRWSEWNGNGRPLIADAYKDFLGETVQMIKLLARIRGLRPLLAFPPLQINGLGGKVFTTAGLGSVGRRR
jgi:hypothetical protein